MKRWEYLLPALVVAFLPGMNFAEEPKKNPKTEVLMEQVVVTATRTGVPEGELGVSATVISAQEIERRKASDVLELLRDVAGLNIVQSGSRGGLAELYTRGGESNFTLVLIDGVRVNEAGGGFDFSGLTTNNIDRIEIIRGPQSALYGSDAISGVIHIITKRGAGKPGVSVLTSHGAHSENGNYIGDQRVGISGGIEQIGYTFSYERADDKGILDVNNEFYNNALSGRLDFYPSDRWDLTFTGRMKDSHFEFPTENGGDRPDRIFPGLDPGQYQNTQDTVLSGQSRFDLFPWWEHVLHLGLHRLNKEFRDPPNAETALDAAPGSSTDSLETRTTFDYHMNIRHNHGDKLRSILTLGYERDKESLDLDSLSTFVFGPPPFGVFTSTEKIDTHRTNHAYYLQEQLTLLEHLHITGGIRMEDNSQFGTDVNPRGSIAYEIKETGTKLRGSIGTGIKEPTFLENFGGFGTVGNPNLKPEQSFSWEVGFDQNLASGRGFFGLTYFHNNFEDLIAYVSPTFPAPTPLPPNYFNIREAESWGIELKFKVNAGYGLTVGGTYTHLETEVVDDGGLNNPDFAKGKPLLRRPKHSGSFYLDWLWERLNIYLSGTYVGKRDDLFFTVEPDSFGFFVFQSQRIENNDYLVLDLVASYTLSIHQSLLKNVRLFVKGRNILDEKYEEALGYSSPLFSAMAGLELAF